MQPVPQRESAPLGTAHDHVAGQHSLSKLPEYAYRGAIIATALLLLWTAA